VRTYRLCRRALMFHHFADQPGVGLNCLVRSTNLVHAAAPSNDPSEAYYAYLVSVTQSGHVRSGAGYLTRSMPPLEFGYTAARLDETVRDVDPQSIENLPEGFEDGAYRWVDLDGEGAAGITCTSSCFKLRHNHSTKTLSSQRPRPSMLIRTPAVSRRSVKALLVNCAPWSVLKISGRPRRSASSSASRLNEV
jgi:hypothetical protein